MNIKPEYKLMVFLLRYSLKFFTLLNLNPFQILDNSIQNLKIGMKIILDVKYFLFLN